MPGIYLGAGGVKTTTGLYVGAGGVKEVKEAYVGVGGSPKKVWPSYVGVDLIGSSGSLTTYISSTSSDLTTSTRLNQSFTWDGEKYAASVYCQHSPYTEGDGSSDRTLSSHHGVWAVFNVGSDIVNYKWIYVKMGWSTNYTGSNTNTITYYTSCQSGSSTQPSSYSSYYQTSIAGNAFCAIDMSARTSSSRRYIGVEGNVYLYGSYGMSCTAQIYLYVLAVYDSNGHPDASYTYTL